MRTSRRFLLAALLLTGVAGATLDRGVVAQQAPAKPMPEKTAVAIFAGGCFWCMEPPFDAIDGVVSTTSGYIGGMRVNPNYKDVSAGTTGHTEALKIVYDPTKVNYDKLLQVFWRNHDPLTADGQFCDKGSQYRPGVFFATEDEKKLAEAQKAALDQSGRFKTKIVTEITQATTFYPAEDYHQDYYTKNPLRYKYYSTSCGRAKRLKELWGDEAGGQS